MVGWKKKITEISRIGGIFFVHNARNAGRLPGHLGRRPSEREREKVPPKEKEKGFSLRT